MIRDASFVLLSAGLISLAAGCPTTYVTLGDDGSAGSAGTDYSCGTAGIGDPCWSAAGIGGFGGTAGGGVGGTGGVGGGGAPGFAGASGACAPSEETLQSCAYHLPLGDVPNDVYGYNACLNGNDGVGGGGADLCEGYAPCSYQHEECLFYRTGGAAGSSNLGCAGAPGEEVWLQDCGGSGYYGPDIVDAGAGGAGGVGGVAGIAGMVAGGSGGVAGEVAGAGGSAGP